MRVKRRKIHSEIQWYNEGLSYDMGASEVYNNHIAVMTFC